MENLIEKVDNLFASFDNSDMINYLTYESFACEGLEDWATSKSTEHFGQECFCDCGASRFCIIPKEENFVLVLGNESHGVSPEIIKKADKVVKIEMEDAIDSLNVAVAAGILMNYFK